MRGIPEHRIGVHIGRAGSSAWVLSFGGWAVSEGPRPLALRPRLTTGVPLSGAHSRGALDWACTTELGCDEAMVYRGARRLDVSPRPRACAIDFARTYDARTLATRRDGAGSGTGGAPVGRVGGLAGEVVAGESEEVVRVGGVRRGRIASAVEEECPSPPVAAVEPVSLGDHGGLGGFGHAAG